MHELGLAEGILAVVTDLAGDGVVTRVTVRVGEEQRIASDSLEFGFQLLAEGTGCERATLQCVAVPGTIVLVDEVELAGDPPTVLRRPGAEVVEPPHVHAHANGQRATGQGATTAPVESAQTQGGA